MLKFHAKIINKKYPKKFRVSKQTKIPFPLLFPLGYCLK